MSKKKRLWIKWLYFYNLRNLIDLYNLHLKSSFTLLIKRWGGNIKIKKWI